MTAGSGDGIRSADGRRLAGPLAAVATGITITVAALLAASGGSTAPSDPLGDAGWTALPDPPLSARQGATAIHVGDFVVVVGGDDAPPCPPNADCVAPGRPLSDGARYDPTTRTWSAIAPAPVAIGGASTAVAGGDAYFWVPSPGAGPPSFLAYHVGTDSWTTLPLPPVLAQASIRLAATGDTVIAYPPSHELGDRVDQAFEVASGIWRDLPADPLTPSFDRTIVAVGGRLVSIAVELVPNPGQRPPVYRAAVLDLTAGAWRRLPDAPIVGSDPTWFAVDDLVVNPTLSGADGGQTNNWGRTFPFGGVLDLQGEAWVGFGQPGAGGGSFGGQPSAGSRFVVNRQGWVLDVDQLAWIPAGGPDGGPESGGATAWARDQLILFGGVRFAGNAGSLLGRAWIWRPPTT